jgi:hypothetical protein
MRTQTGLLTTMRRAVYGLSRAVAVTMIGAPLALEQEPEPE